MPHCSFGELGGSLRGLEISRAFWLVAASTLELRLRILGFLCLAIVG